MSVRLKNLNSYAKLDQVFTAEDEKIMSIYDNQDNLLWGTKLPTYVKVNGNFDNNSSGGGGSGTGGGQSGTDFTDTAVETTSDPTQWTNIVVEGEGQGTSGNEGGGGNEGGSTGGGSGSSSGSSGAVSGGITTFSYPYYFLNYIIEYNDNVLLKQSKNLLPDISTWTYGKAYDAGGNLNNTTFGFLSDLIQVTSGELYLYIADDLLQTSYAVNGDPEYAYVKMYNEDRETFRFCMQNNAKVNLSTARSYIFKIPEDIKYIQFSFKFFKKNMKLINLSNLSNSEKKSNLIKTITIQTKNENNSTLSIDTIDPSNEFIQTNNPNEMNKIFIDSTANLGPTINIDMQVNENNYYQLFYIYENSNGAPYRVQIKQVLFSNVNGGYDAGPMTQGIIYGDRSFGSFPIKTNSGNVNSRSMRLKLEYSSYALPSGSQKVTIYLINITSSALRGINYDKHILPIKLKTYKRIEGSSPQTYSMLFNCYLPEDIKEGDEIHYKLPDSLKQVNKQKMKITSSKKNCLDIEQLSPRIFCFNGEIFNKNSINNSVTIQIKQSDPITGNEIDNGYFSFYQCYAGFTIYNPPIIMGENDFIQINLIDKNGGDPKSIVFQKSDISSSSTCLSKYITFNNNKNNPFQCSIIQIIFSTNNNNNVAPPTIALANMILGISSSYYNLQQPLESQEEGLQYFLITKNQNNVYEKKPLKFLPALYTTANLTKADVLTDPRPATFQIF